jgi:hypothetical protein
MKVSARTKKNPTPVSVEYDIPDGVEALTKKFGPEVVGAAAKGAIVISLQAFIRRGLDKGTALADIQKNVAAWKPDVRTVNKQSAFEKAANSLDKLSADERKALLAKLQSIK